MATRFHAETAFTAADEQPLQAESAGDFKSETFNQWVHDPVANVGLNIWFASGENGGMQFPLGGGGKTVRRPTPPVPVSRRQN